MGERALQHLSTTLLVSVALCVFLSASLSAAEHTVEDADGRHLYIKYGCYQCHGYEGQGALFTGPRIAPDPLPLPAFAEIIRRPYGSMPAYSPAVLDDATLEAIHRYLLSIAE